MNASEIIRTGMSASSVNVQNISNRARISRWLGLAIFLVIVFGAPSLLFRYDEGTNFDLATLGDLDRRRPDFVFIGNSMLETRIDPGHLTRLLGDRNVVSLAVPGSQSAIWYLQLKNLVAASETPPETVFIFFRNDLITRPLEALGGRNTDLIESLSRPGDDQFEGVLEAKRSLHLRTLNAIESVYPLQRRNADALDGLSEAAAALLPSSRELLASRADDVFAFHNLRDPEDEGTPIEPVEPFSSSVSSSFLPLMLDVAADAGINLVLVRVQARPTPDGAVRESENMRRYSQELAEYLAARGVGYMDFTGNPAVDRGLYYDSFHIRQRYLQDYTELFLDEAERFFDGEEPWAAEAGG